MKMIKLSSDHYIIVDDSEIKEGDWTYHHVKGIYEARVDGAYTNQKKITHSTIPLESMNHGNYSSSVYLDIEKLSLQEVKELIGQVDVEGKAERANGYAYYGKPNGEKYLAFKEGFIEGYNQALEDNKEKKYTEEDILNILYDYDNVDWSKREHKQSVIMMKEWLYEKLQSFQPKTEWEVEFVDGKLTLV